MDDVGDETDTRSRFTTGLTDLLGGAFDVPAGPAAAIACCLYARMADGSLHYHTPRHVLAIWDFYGAIPEADRPRLAPVDRAAIWFHDAVYVPTAASGLSEQWSAAFAATLLAGWLSTPDLARLVDLILATACHDQSGPIAPPGADLILDLDLSNLATDGFAASSAAIRREFGHLDDGAWRAGRAAFLRAMLGRPSIYRTPLFRDRYEAAARANLEAALRSDPAS